MEMDPVLSQRGSIDGENLFPARTLIPARNNASTPLSMTEIEYDEKCFDSAQHDRN